jgi:hypothetical protein
MTEGAKLHAPQINHGQSEIWLEVDGKELTQRRRLATNEVVNVTRRHCAHEVIQNVLRGLSHRCGPRRYSGCADLDEIAAELMLKA